MTNDAKAAVKSFWEAGSCGEVYAVGDDLRTQFDRQAAERYVLEPYILSFAKFADGKGKDVLEVGVGMGADHLEWARSNPASLKGIDLTERAVDWTAKRLELYGYTPDVRVGDAENLPFPDNSFDLVYSFGVIHCSPDTPRCFREIHRVLRPGGQARIMIYSRYSMVGYMLWLRYGLFAGKPGRTLTDIYAEHLESPGIKCYTVEETREMCADFASADIRTMLSFGDLLEGEVGQRHRGLILRIAKLLYPRWLVKTFFRNHGMALMVTANKEKIGGGGFRRRGARRTQIEAGHTVTLELSAPDRRTQRLDRVAGAGG